MSNKKVLYISYDGMTDPLGQSQVLPYLEALSLRGGYKFTILSFEKKARYDKEKHAIIAICERAGINWQPLFYTKNPPVISKIYDRWQMKRRSEQLHQQERFDMIHCRSYVAAEMGLSLKKATGVKFLFDMRGFWADEKVDNGQWNQQNILFRKIYNHYKQKEKDFLLEADAVISLTHAARKELLEQEVYKHLRVDVIPCCADLHHFDYNQVGLQQVAQLREHLQIGKDKKVITYLGSVGGWYMTKEMFKFMKILMAQHPEFIMLVLTKDDQEQVKKEAQEEGVPAGRLLVTYATRKELPAHIAISDCSIFFIRPTYSKVASSPTKHAELMGMGIPVICNDIGDTGHIVENSKTGFIVRNFSNAEFEDITTRMNELMDITKESIREEAFRYFDLEKGINSYLDVYKRLLLTEPALVKS